MELMFGGWGQEINQRRMENLSTNWDKAMEGEAQGAV